jgi:hypothetical protein
MSVGALMGCWKKYGNGLQVSSIESYPSAGEPFDDNGVFFCGFGFVPTHTSLHARNDVEPIEMVTNQP